jgi:TRAP-type C4-dicarboxylate transport system permease small subunit
VADIVLSETTRRYEGVGLVLDKACKGLAVVSGVTLTAMALMSLRSIVGRTFFESPLLGDYELVQMMSAVAVVMALPYANWIGGHVIVDFFTAKASVKTNAALDWVAQALMAAFSALLTWKITMGMLDLKGNMDASMMLNIPTWWSYAPMVPAFALLTATSVFAAHDHLRKLLK